MSVNTYKKIYPTGPSSPKIYGVPKYIRNISPEAHYIKHRSCDIWGSYRTSKNS